MARKLNKYKLEPKIQLYEVSIVSEYNGSKVDPKALVAKITGKDESFHIFILPDYVSKFVKMGCDSNTDFAQQVTQLMMESGEAEHLITQVYNNCFGRYIGDSLDNNNNAPIEQVTYTLLK
jgi:hypothetical protein